VVLLVKPQFEVGRDKVGKKGVVRNPQDQAQAIAQVLDSARELGWGEMGLTYSPIKGPAGNIEYLLWLGMDRGDGPALTLDVILALVRRAHRDLSAPSS
jgi:23S rRNA (cytidine1920-2'-O)/16S rRNA (cytidine1409-2'-O)-methyltransferase